MANIVMLHMLTGFASANRQWGNTGPNGNHPWYGSYPITFPNKAFSVLINRIFGKGCYSWTFTDYSNSSNFYWDEIADDGSNGSGDLMYFIAIGK